MDYTLKQLNVVKSLLIKKLLLGFTNSKYQSIIQVMAKKIVKYIKWVMSVLIFASLFALALPEFSFAFGGNTYTYPSIGFSRIGVPSDFPSLRKSTDLFTANIYSVELTFTDDIEDSRRNDILDDYVTRIQDRINHSGLHAITVKLVQVNNENYELELIVPEDFVGAETIIPVLTSRGEISFEEGLTNPINLNDYDIMGVPTQAFYDFVTNNSIATRELIPAFGGFFGQLIEYRLEVIKGFEVLPSFEQQSDNDGNVLSSGLVTMSVDNSPVIQLSPMFDPFTRNNVGTLLVGRPFGSIGANTPHFYSVISHLFTEESPVDSTLVTTFDINDAETRLSEYSVDGLHFIYITFGVSILLLGMYWLRKYGFRQLLAMTYILLTSILGFLVVAKVVQASLSIGTVFGIIFAIVLSAFVIEQFVKNQSVAEAKTYLINIINTHLLVLFIAMTVASLQLNIGVWNDFLGILIAYKAWSIISFGMLYALSLESLEKYLFTNTNN